MKAVAAKRRRFGYRRIGVMLERKGMIMNHKKLYRLYTDEKLGGAAAKGPQTSAGIENTHARGATTGRTLVARLFV
jgi:putative transposase